jgi:hypothetical protein
MTFQLAKRLGSPGWIPQRVVPIVPMYGRMYIHTFTDVQQSTSCFAPTRKVFKRGQNTYHFIYNVVVPPSLHISCSDRPTCSTIVGQGPHADGDKLGQATSRTCLGDCGLWGILFCCMPMWPAGLPARSRRKRVQDKRLLAQRMGPDVETLVLQATCRGTWLSCKWAPAYLSLAAQSPNSMVV